MFTLLDIYSVVFHGLAAAMILYLISVGLSVTMGLMGFVNLAHGVFAMAGGYFAIIAFRTLGQPFAPSIIFASVMVGILSIPLERLLFSRLYTATDLDQVLFTIGFVFFATAVATAFFGPTNANMGLPASLTGQIDFGLGALPTYRLLIIVSGFFVYLVLWLGVERTLFGARLRAAVDNRRMAQTVGVRTDRLFTLSFALGSALAAFGGALGAEFLPIRPYYAIDQLTYVLIVVSVGGMGSISGPFLAALLLGISDTACKYFAPEVGSFFIFAVIIALLLWRPNGLLGRT